MTYGELHKYLKAYNKKAAAEGRPFEDLFSEYQSEMTKPPTKWNGCAA